MLGVVFGWVWVGYEVGLALSLVLGFASKDSIEGGVTILRLTASSSLRKYLFIECSSGTKEMTDLQHNTFKIVS